MRIGYKGLLLFFGSLTGSFAQAQEHTPYRQPLEWITRGEDAYRAGLYDIAALDAKHYGQNGNVSGIPQDHPGEAIAAQYIRTSARLFNGSEDSALALLHTTTDKAFHDRLALGIARSYFLKGALAEAIPYYREAGIANSTNTEIADSKFELAYCLFNSKQFDAAEPLFAIIREVQGKYYSAGNYYYGLLAYNKGEYADALRSFDRINNEPAYRSTVPYYMAELEYYLGNREKALKDALRLIKRPEKLYYDNELHLLAAQCLFEADRYGDALPYFEYYYKNSDKIRKEELYEMSYAYYRVTEWQHAVEGFRQLSTEKDSLGQTSMYLLGDCYLKTGDRSSARNAFGLCSELAYNTGQREAALLLYAQLSAAQGFTSDALRGANTLLKDYPETSRRNDAYDVLARVYAGTRNYPEAYRSLHQITAAGNLRELLQPVAYGYGLQQLQQGNTLLADSLLDESLASGNVGEYTGAAAFWKAEIAVRTHRSGDAISNGQRFLLHSKEASSIAPEATPAAAYSLMGYAALDAKDYGAAQQYFRKAGEGGSNDAQLREADALFMQKNFAAAAPLYSKAISAGNGGDYARLQQAIIAGVKGRKDEKIRTLQSILATVPPSPYAADARYELGATQIENGAYQPAIETLTPLSHADSKMAPKALLKIGTAYSLTGNTDKAEAAFTTIVKNYPASPERADALTALKSSYINRNNPEGFANLLRDAGINNDSSNDAEAIYYSAAEAQYASQSWKGAATGFEKYLASFPAGPHSLKAQYYLGESLYRQKEYASALSHYTSVYTGDWNEFSENAALRSAAILYAAKDWSAALGAYSAVRAHTTDSTSSRTSLAGAMRSAAQLSAAPADTLSTSDNARMVLLAGACADTLLALGNVSAAQKEEANLYQARAAMANSNYAGADALFSTLQYSHNDAIAAEARYYHAAALLNGGKLKDAEDAAGRNIKKGGGSDYWVVKSYILLGDIFTAEKDYFNARATLQSVAAHASIESLKAEAGRKLAALPAPEGAKLSNE